MNKGTLTANETGPKLPSELIDWLHRPISRFLRLQTAGGAVLLSFAVFALVLANSPWGKGYLQFWETEIGLFAGPLEISRSIRAWINDGLMTLFFFLIALELPGCPSLALT